MAKDMIDPISDAINELTNAILLSLPIIIPINIPTNKKNGIIVEESVLNSEKITIIIIAMIILFTFIISFILILSPLKKIIKKDNNLLFILVVDLQLHQSLQGSIHLQYTPVHIWRRIAVLPFYPV